ncbi:hypothetical protein YA0783_24930 [Pseudomonas corrugata]|uniref:hypothetical protein n=1 Tax=Pseudomonas corrugata TaxID=47879 RepID=UPI0018E5D6C5|nr:hypothetical protein [Pseudomonas corrugata]MBI6694228.1 hypothetical protein [Pseudomonas corrugata]
MKIDVPNVAEQQAFIFEQATKAAIAQLLANLNAPRIPLQANQTAWANTHLLREREGWEPPSADVVGAYFRHFQEHFPDYGTDAKLADLLYGPGCDRRKIRAIKNGTVAVPYRIWRRFLILTGRVPEDITPVMAFMG